MLIPYETQRLQIAGTQARCPRSQDVRDAGTVPPRSHHSDSGLWVCRPALKDRAASLPSSKTACEENTLLFQRDYRDR